MTTNRLIFSPNSKIELATNFFINVPIILRYENINLIEVIREDTINFTTKIPIFHSDGTFLAEAKGNRIFLTEDGKKAGVKMEQFPNLWVCKMNGKTVFEIKQRSPDFFKTTAELYTNDGYFVKCQDDPTPQLIDISGDSLKVGGLIMSGNTISGFKAGIWIRKDGSIAIGVNSL